MATNVLDKINKIPVLIKVVCLAVVVTAIVLGFHFMQWKAIDGEIESLTQEQVQLERELAENQRIADDLPVFQQNIQRLEEDLDEALEQLPREKEIPALLRDIYTLGAKSGVEFQSFEPQGMQTQQMYSEVPIRLRINGGYHEVAVFFDRVGKLSRIVNIHDIEFSSSRTDEGEARLTVNCTATTFMFTGRRS